MIYDFKNKSLKSEGKNWIASNATIIGDIVIKNDVSIWFNVVLREVFFGLIIVLQFKTRFFNIKNYLDAASFFKI